MHKVEAEIIMNASPSLVFNAFTEFEMLKEWWGVERCLIEKKAGGVYSLAWGISESGFRYVLSGTINIYKENEELEISNLVYFNPEKPILGPMSLRIKLGKINNSTRLILVQDGYQTGIDWGWYYEAVKEAWPQVLISLKEYIE
jgi:uncharacterized protein YndB with AHSA1/START domain